MEYPEHYMDDVLRFFDGRPEELALYQTLEERLAAALPDTRVKVQRTQITEGELCGGKKGSWHRGRQRPVPERGVSCSLTATTAQTSPARTKEAAQPPDWGQLCRVGASPSRSGLR